MFDQGGTSVLTYTIGDEQMPVWGRKLFGLIDWARDQEKIDQMCLADGRWREFLMVSIQDESNLRWPTTVYIMVPNGAVLAAFPGYERILEAHLPKRASLLFGDANEFERIFKFR
jgi:hypothetical protein